MKKRLIFLPFLVLLMGADNCEYKKPSAIKYPQKVEESRNPLVGYDMSVAITIGNHSYIPLNLYADLYGTPNEHVAKILGVIDAFEKSHPDRDTVSWQLDKQQNSGSLPAYISGIWIDHKPRIKLRPVN